MGMGAAATDKHWEGSDVLLLESVAVAVTNSPAETGTRKLAVKLALPLPSVARFLVPRNVSPSPLPEGSHTLFEKNSSLKYRAGRAVESSLNGNAAADSTGEYGEVLEVVSAAITVP